MIIVYTRFTVQQCMVCALLCYNFFCYIFFFIFFKMTTSSFPSILFFRLIHVLFKFMPYLF